MTPAESLRRTRPADSWRNCSLKVAVLSIDYVYVMRNLTPKAHGEESTQTEAETK